MHPSPASAREAEERLAVQARSLVLDVLAPHYGVRLALCVARVCCCTHGRVCRRVGRRVIVDQLYRHCGRVGAHPDVPHGLVGFALGLRVWLRGVHRLVDLALVLLALRQRLPRLLHEPPHGLQVLVKHWRFDHGELLRVSLREVHDLTQHGLVALVAHKAGHLQQLRSVRPPLCGPGGLAGRGRLLFQPLRLEAEHRRSRRQRRLGCLLGLLRLGHERWRLGRLAGLCKLRRAQRRLGLLRLGCKSRCRGRLLELCSLLGRARLEPELRCSGRLLRLNCLVRLLRL
mmetsp:Transcript_32052/g.98523  ORF Transcript_32052/g.98523 Transcript_32052/m.98523 type:complete len:287 (+) Transcript_32052:117-977(+)